MLSLFRLRGLVYTLVGTLVLTTLWVTSLTLLSARPAATDLLTEAGTHVLNPFLVDRGFGLSQSTYAALEATARAHPSQPLSLGVLKVHILGREIADRKYPAVVQLVYGRVAETYYDGGAKAAFVIPPQLTAELPNFGMFNPNNVPLVPGGVTPAQLPVFLQPFFTFVGLTPDTFTAAGHQKLATLLPWFWIALVVLAVLSVVFDHSEQKLAGMLHGVVHGSWPVVLVLAGLWVLSRVYPATFAPYLGLLGIVSRAFLPVYGTVFVLGLIGLVITKVLARGGLRRQQSPAMVTAGGSYSGFPQAPYMPAGQTESNRYVPHASQPTPPYVPGQAGPTPPFPPDDGENR